jgi:signal transduction histidine kinase
MVAALAHEIKNPLNSMKGAGQYLHDKYREKDDIVEFTGIIIDEINRLERYLNEFLSFSRGINLKLKLTNLESYIKCIVMTVKHSFPVDIKIMVEGSKVPDVYIDPEQMRQVLVNFFSNAKDALSGVKHPKAEIIISAGSKYAYIALRDNGRGISRKDLKYIFDPFYTTKETGIGIGLAISKSIVSKHGGKIMVKSVKNKGTEFIIAIPVKNRDMGRRDE